MRAINSLWALAAAAGVGCTGASWGENVPGGDTWVEPPPPGEGQHRMGALAVERDQDHVWAVHEEVRSGETFSRLAMIDPDAGTVRDVLDVSGTEDRRVVFPTDDRVLLMAQHDGTEELVLIDSDTGAVRNRATKPTWYWGTRTAPSGRTLAVADNADRLAPIHLIDTATLVHRVVPHGGQAIEAMWAHGADFLMVVSATDPFTSTSSVRALRFDLRGADLSRPLPAPQVMWQGGGYDWDFAFSYTWIGISPDDRWVVFPLISPERTHVLLIADQVTGETAVVPGRGPVGFTRDSAWIVSYGPRPVGPDEPSGEDLWLIDPVTHERRVVTLPFAGGVLFHALRDADYVVCTPSTSPELPVVYDVAADQVYPLDEPVGLYDFVARPGHGELWLRTGSRVSVLDVAAAATEPVALGGHLASTINGRPAFDRAVIGDGTAVTIQQYDMETRDPWGGEIELPRPRSTSAPPLLRTRSARAPSAWAQSPFDPAYWRPELVGRSGDLASLLE